MSLDDVIIPQPESSRRPFSSYSPTGLQAAAEDTEKLPSDDGDSNETRRDPEFQPPKDFELSKHDKGWRKIVRNFTPSYVFLAHRYKHISSCALSVKACAVHVAPLTIRLASNL